MADESELSARGFVIAMLGVGVLLCCGVPGGAIYLVRKDNRDEVGIRAAGDAYLTAVVRGDFDAAYDLLCKADRSRESRAAWVARGPLDPAPSGFRITDVTFERPMHTPTLRTVIAEVSYPGRPSREVHLPVEQQGGDWKMCSPQLP
ncbi:hypothetical protein [Micromonospora cathayae]|uniref:DUF4878 domain-containing protein n=1 Tax=Micromonospora cathayae TaxID=3028804 RepID=A0ABY7ZSD9_9ACTN|nr:hypothetical protein [Micromonospora sp. HUAS 3]WDZ85907.1 hypothetical protein PVK37_05615 [Micromonospora sp. HUAS 3]